MWNLEEKQMQQEELQKDTLNEEVEVDTKEETTEDNVYDINSKLEENKLDIPLCKYPVFSSIALMWL